MTFPFSTHNLPVAYGGRGCVDPDEDVRLVVLPPPSWSTARQRAGRWLCVGAPGIRLRSIAASATSAFRLGYFWCARRRRCSDSGAWSEKKPRSSRADQGGVSRRLNYRTAREPRRWWRGSCRYGGSGEAEVILRHARRPPEIRRMGRSAMSSRYRGRKGGDSRPIPLRPPAHAQMVRWGQTSVRSGGVKTAEGRCSSGILRRSVGTSGPMERGLPGSIGAFAGPVFDRTTVAATCLVRRLEHAP